MRVFGTTRLAALPLAAALACAVTAVGGCRREPQAPATAGAGKAAQGTVATTGASAAAKLEDVVEQTPTYLVGISYPKGVALPTGLASEMRAYADASRKRLLDAAAGHKPGDKGIPYDMSLQFRELSGTGARVLAVAADGSLYAGGEQGEPLIRRFLWDRQTGRLLRSTDLLNSADGWNAISASARESLLGQVRTRMEEDKHTPQEISAALETMKPVIEAGTLPDAANFSEFEPLLDTQGRVTGLTFVFKPLQVAGYADGVQRAEVPASVFAPYLAPGVSDLFAH